MTKAFLLQIITLFLTVFSYSQEVPKEKLKLFVEGNTEDFNYIRNNTPFVNFVNDPKVCEVHVIISEQNTGGGGSHYSFEFYGVAFPNIATFKLSCYTFSYDTNEIIRQKLVKSLHAGILPFINEKNGLNGIEIKSTMDSTDLETESSQIEYNDPWKQWVFRIGGDIGFEGEERKKELEYSISARANKVTDSWKISNQYDYEKREETIEKDNGEKIKSLRIEQDADIRIVFSINDHWSYALFMEGSQNTYRNIKMGFEAIPAIQYNFYDWHESDRRQFTFSYFIGPTYNKYYETTIYDKMKE